MSIETVRAADLIEDMGVYPRSQVDTVHIGNLEQALRAGAVFPPLRADLQTRRLSDGFHRRRATLRVHGDDAEVQVEFIDFASDTELFADAVATNVGHGKGLYEVEKRRAALRLSDEGLDDGQVAIVLSVPETKIQKIRISTAEVTLGGGQIKLEPLKRPVVHFAGQSMTEPQARAARSAPGTSYALTVRQLRDALRFNLIDRTKLGLMEQLAILHSELGEYLAEDGEAAAV